MSLPSSSDPLCAPLPELGPDLPAIARRLRETEIAATLAPVRKALAGTQTADAALWLSSRLGAAVEAYAGRVAEASEAETSDEPDDAEETGVAEDVEDADREPAA